MKPIQHEFEALLKQSPHFADAFNAHRTATGEILAVFIEHLVHNKMVPAEDAIAILRRIDRRTDRPSIDSSRRHLIAVIRESLQKAPKA